MEAPKQADKNDYKKKLTKLCVKTCENSNELTKVDVESEIDQLRRVFHIPNNDFHMKIIRPTFGECAKFDYLSGTLNIGSPKFSILSRGRQGPAVSIVAIATSQIILPKCWTEKVIDQILHDGDKYYIESYQNSKAKNRDEFLVTHLQWQFRFQKSKVAYVKIGDVNFVGNFQSADPRSMCLIEALETFFLSKDHCLLTSSILNIAIWKCDKHFYIFDGQHRDETGKISDKDEFAMLFTFQNLITMLYFILKHCRLQNEAFVVRNISIRKIEDVCEKSAKVTKDFIYEQSPSGYRILNNFRAMVQGSYHLTNFPISEPLRSKSHLILAVACLIYSCLVEANRWSSALLDLIFNQSNVYLIDFVISLGKKFDDLFEINVSDLVADVILGIYSAKIKVEKNVTSGTGNKILESEVRNFFQTYPTGVIEVRKFNFAIWKCNNKYYFFDVHACDINGLRLNSDVPKKASCSVFMASSIRELSQILIENLDINEKTGFALHGIRVLYIKAVDPEDPSKEDIVFRAENTRRRPDPFEVGLPMKSEEDLKKQGVVVDKLLEITHITEGVQKIAQKFPDLIKDAEIILLTEEQEKNLIFVKKFGDDFEVLNENVVLLKGTINCCDEKINRKSRGRQGAIIPVISLIRSRMKPVVSWNKFDVDEVIKNGNQSFEEFQIEEESEDDSDVDDSEDDDEDEDAYSIFEITMLPDDLTLPTYIATINTIPDTETVDTSDLDDLQFALDNYFEDYTEMVLENSEKYYAVWKSDGHYSFFNPYGFGTDDDTPASILVTNELQELVNAIESIGDDDIVTFHCVQILSVEERDFRKFRISPDASVLTLASRDRKKLTDSKDLEEKMKAAVQLHETLNSPDAFTLFLISCNRKQNDEIDRPIEETAYENLKSTKPYLFSNKRILCTLLEAKQASKSVQSLLSRFSIDSKLPMKQGDLRKSIEKEDVEKLKVTKLSPNIYFYSKDLSDDAYPVRSIKGFFLKKDKVREDETPKTVEMFEDVAIGEIKPLLVPLGPIIRTPVPQSCTRSELKKSKRNLNQLHDKYDIVLNMFIQNQEEKKSESVREIQEETNDVLPEKEDEKVKMISTLIKENTTSYDKFQPTSKESVKIIKGSTSFDDRLTYENCYYKPCLFSSIIMILIKSMVNVEEEFSHCLLDYCILQAHKYYQQCHRLRYKDFRRIFNIEVLGMIFDVIVEEVLQADPENFDEQKLANGIKNFDAYNKTGIIVFPNVTYAFWYDNAYYLFDSYGCDQDGAASEIGECALTVHESQASMIDRITKNTGNFFPKPYRLYVVAVSHMSPKLDTTRLKIENKIHLDNSEYDSKSEDSDESLSDECFESESSTSVGFYNLPNYDGAVLDVPLTDKDPILVPSVQLLQNRNSKIANVSSKIDEILEVPIDLCIMAWSQINDPSKWNAETIRALYEVSKKNAIYKCTTSKKYFNDNKAEFDIENYCFRAAFAPLFHGPSYEHNEDADLSMTLKKIFKTENYSGAIICLGDSHIGAMKNKSKFYAWWAVRGTNNIRLVTSKHLKELVKIIFEDTETKSVHFTVRPVRVSYASFIGFDWMSKVQEKSYDPNIIFKPTIAINCPIFVFGTTAIKTRNVIREPKLKKCYFVAILAVLLKRDIVNCPSPGLIDKVIELAKFLYHKISNAVYYSDVILHKIPIFNRIFDFRDHAHQLVINENTDFYLTIKNHLRKFFNTHSCGIIQFTNCCYGFWYSELKNNYYYIDPYGCDECGRKSKKDGRSCLGIFPTLSKMVKNMYSKLIPGTTGFFLHNLHVNSVNVPLIRNSPEDSIWTYLDFHWLYDGTGVFNGKKKNGTEIRRPKWNFYTVEIPHCIYSLWGSIGTYDVSFGKLAGKNKAAICVAVLALRDLVQEDQWSSKFLDFCVRQGHEYFLQSQKKIWKNRLKLQPFWTISPYFTWDLTFDAGTVGKLYDNVDRQSLKEILENWITDDDLQTGILQCGDVVLGLLRNNYAFYIINPCLTGLPVFPKNRGAIFVLRCQNIYSSLYCLIKSINTHRQLQFCLTTVTTSFYKSIENSGISCLKIPEMLNFKQKPLSQKVCKNINEAFDPVTCPNSDSLSCFEVNLSLGLIEMSKQKGSSVETYQMVEVEPPKFSRSVRCGFPRLIEYLEGSVTNERIPKRQQMSLESSESSSSILTRSELKLFIKKWKTKLYLKYCKEKSEDTVEESAVVGSSDDDDELIQNLRKLSQLSDGPEEAFDQLPGFGNEPEDGAAILGDPSEIMNLIEDGGKTKKINENEGAEAKDKEKEKEDKDEENKDKEEEKEDQEESKDQEDDENKKKKEETEGEEEDGGNENGTEVKEEEEGEEEETVEKQEENERIGGEERTLSQ